MRGKAITLHNSGYPQKSPNIHHRGAAHSSQDGTKGAEEEKVCVIPLIKSQESAAKVILPSKKSFVPGKLVWAGAIILA